MAVRLTDNLLRSLQPPDAGDPPEILRDSVCRGLICKVGRKQVRWVFEYRDPASLGGRRKRKKITHPDPYRHFSNSMVGLSLAQARMWADDLAARVRRGEDPKVEPLVDHNIPITFGEAAQRWVDEVAINNRSYYDQKKMVQEYLPVDWTISPLDKITRGHSRMLLEKLAKERGKPMANRIASTVSSVFSYAVEFEWADRNPMRGVKRFPEEPRVRVLNFSEIRRLWWTCENHGGPAARVVQLLLLTGQRFREILYARWDEIEGRWLHIPGDTQVECSDGFLVPRTTKNKRDHSIYLADTTWEILQQMDHSSEWVFPSPILPSRPILDPKNGVRTLKKRAGVRDWRIQDMRTTFATQSRDAGVPRLLVSLCLNHTILGVDNPLDRAAGVTERHYFDRGGYQKELQTAWETWDQKLRGIVDSDGRVLSFADHSPTGRRSAL